jgi:hypothetical protein
MKAVVGACSLTSLHKYAYGTSPYVGMRSEGREALGTDNACFDPVQSYREQYSHARYRDFSQV